MNEVRVYGIVLVALLLGAYMSWTREDPVESDGKVVLFEAQQEEITRLELVTRTQTVSLSFKELEGQMTPWFTTESKTRKRAFAGNDEAKKLIKKFAPFEALRSLGKDLSEEELATTKLDTKPSKLVIVAGKTDRSFRVGGKTGGSRDFYVQRKGDSEVFLVASKTIGDLQYPDGKYMQRKLRRQAKTEVGALEVEAGGVKRKLIQKNRLSSSDAFWSTSEDPDTKNDQAGEWANKLEKLTVVDYLDDPSEFDKATPVLTAKYTTESGELLAQFELRRIDEQKRARYVAKSSATRWPVKVSSFAGEEVEKSLATILNP